MENGSLPESKNFLTVPAAILIAGSMISLAVIYATGRNSVQPANVGEALGDSAPSGAPTENLRLVGSSDHIRGNLGAKAVVVEYSDTECPFCKRFHDTMRQVTDEYSNNVAWVYRHFPLDSLHPKARKEAEATECAAELGGNETFWAYLDRLFEVTPSNNGLAFSELSNIAEYVGLNRQKFDSCVNSGKYAEKVEKDYQNAVASGGSGTPYSIVVAKSGQKLVINGAQPYSAVKQILDAFLLTK
ncbi:MAG: hypothetical protein A3I89_01075 [Candidatus Harrisonbacteria bacterium RIFCSPLOWO2_02_FULL_41_11]|uniref:Thioredoxin domain-containing protein n=1 Tax=Candidatus Harrisonbacteria bacterium RIFCSPHIGHO2_02_FULL_42_16 TaxID=1798404 RepID=A0A1G1ZHA7_9BACT|nr:MAG: hypothetical protein A3B92_03860 [Candidatus Harrisonbacteria bacterium RIFCSPHIGHO2_02_FULL_42_16]OGY67002.1 MAG: hypothetical protein A3I89_01075 [Candidatus Harrisonbacteria bacterium RIFCSPLOWO2_02_FULL_41_11]